MPPFSEGGGGGGGAGVPDGTGGAGGDGATPTLLMIGTVQVPSKN